MGSTIVTPNVVKLTSDTPSMRGGIVNETPLNSRDWEIHLNFKVYGVVGALYADGFAFWYTEHGVQPGEMPTFFLSFALSCR